MPDPNDHAILPPAALERVLRHLRGGLVVSCQARPGEPLFGPTHMVAMALSALAGGAVGLRIEGLADVRAVRAVTTAPVIGLWKIGDEGVYITPTLSAAVQVAEAGADIVALDGTARPRPDGLALAETIRRLKERTAVLVMADVSTVQEGVAAEAAGADFVSTTLSGYTPQSRPGPGPDLGLVSQLAAAVAIPVFAEGRIGTPAEAAEAMRRGAVVVVVGSAVTRPQVITGGFVRELSLVKVPGGAHD
jgi:N-acylglucosamine-6-phosphate 2-epimerase